MWGLGWRTGYARPAEVHGGGWVARDGLVPLTRDGGRPETAGPAYTGPGYGPGNLEISLHV